MRYVLAGFLAFVSFAQVAQKKPPAKPPESFLVWIARITGISATSRGLKGNPNALIGDVWIAQLNKAGAERLTFGDGYSWPVFSKDDQAIIAVRAGELWSVPATGGDPAKLPHSPAGIAGIVGAGPDGLVVFTTTAVGLFSPDSGDFVPFEPATKEDRDAIARMRLPIRSYDDGAITVSELESKIAIEVNGKKERDVETSGERCGQPSVSQNRTNVVYVRARGN